MSIATTTAAAAADVVTVANTTEKPQRRFPPPCWTQEETLALIEAYRERWYALRRGYLRTPDWDSVASTVTERCPGASPAKTSAQCRHKMEKLRQRYRAEKQRAASFPNPGGRYFSSWFFFENMEAMENGTTPPASLPKQENSADETRLKSLLDQNIVKLKLKSKNNANSETDLGFDNGVEPKKSYPGNQIRINYSPYYNSEIPDQNHNLEFTNYGSRSPMMNAIPKPQLKSRGKNSSKVLNSFNISDGFNNQVFPAPLRIRKTENFEPNSRNPNEEFWVRAAINHTTNNSNKFDSNLYPRGGQKRARSALGEIVASIKMLGEGFVKMENAKMEMAREMEEARMEMEMKRNEMLLESQKQIVDAFMKGLLELKKSKKSRTAAAESSQ